MTEFSDLKGKTLVVIDGGIHNSLMTFHTEEGETYFFTPVEDTCGVDDVSVTIEDICGDLQDLIGSPLLMAEMVQEVGHNTTWTFYKLATLKGYVTIRWYGESNGFYSEEVDFYKKEEGTDQ